MRINQYNNISWTEDYCYFYPYHFIVRTRMEILWRAFFTLLYVQTFVNDLCVGCDKGATIDFAVNSWTENNNTTKWHFMPRVFSSEHFALFSLRALVTGYKIEITLLPVMPTSDVDGDITFEQGRGA